MSITLCAKTMVFRYIDRYYAIKPFATLSNDKYFAFRALTPLVGRQEEHAACKTLGDEVHCHAMLLSNTPVNTGVITARHNALQALY